MMCQRFLPHFFAKLTLGRLLDADVFDWLQDYVVTPPTLVGKHNSKNIATPPTLGGGTIQIPIVPPSEREGDHAVVEGANGGG